MSEVTGQFDVKTASSTFAYSEMPQLKEINFNQAQFVVPDMKTIDTGGNAAQILTLSETFRYTDLSSLETIDLRNVIIGLEKFVVIDSQKVRPFNFTFADTKLHSLTSIYFPNVTWSMLLGGGTCTDLNKQFIYETFENHQSSPSNVIIYGYDENKKD
jgi:hypothetical protein